ncbi:GNAT family N-acetyltransferase [uncultured Shewanella sp.]|uniref:GNAT family N-acetyltransferase n=1 Tax=uncultured Shewanella sp. TaxID=173975 RepID=UPI00262ED39A|nr:GNAT family N-acetyltransferase [uncultured Shewanella sp.]
MHTAKWFYPSKLNLKSDTKNGQISSDQRKWSELKLFYRQHLPYSKPNINDQIALISLATQLGQSNHQPDSIQLGSIKVLSDSDLQQTSVINEKLLNEQAKITAAIRLKTIGKSQLITGLVVAEYARGKGLAHQLMNFIRPKLLKKHSYVFAIPELESFYQAYGFHQIISISQNNLVDNDVLQQFDKYHSLERPLILMKKATE